MLDKLADKGIAIRVASPKLVMEEVNVKGIMGIRVEEAKTRSVNNKLLYKEETTNDQGREGRLCCPIKTVLMCVSLRTVAILCPHWAFFSPCSNLIVHFCDEEFTLILYCKHLDSTTKYISTILVEGADNELSSGCFKEAT